MHHMLKGLTSLLRCRRWRRRLVADGLDGMRWEPKYTCRHYVAWQDLSDDDVTTIQTALRNAWRRS